MPQISGRAAAVIALSTFFIAVGLLFVIQNNTDHDLIESTVLNRSGIRDLDVEYSDGKIYLNVEFITPKTCAELVGSLRIQSIVIKTRTYRPTCSRISDTLMRITYTQSITI